MAYEATDWACGDTVTADKLNKLERGVQGIMSDYVPTEWQCGDTITADKLNKLEQAVANAEGGSSDFSTATVTITNSTNSNIMQSCINILEIMGEQSIAAERPIGAGESITCDMVLFKGTQTIYAPDDGDIPVDIAVVGDITEEEGEIVITGDGTITYSSK